MKRWIVGVKRTNEDEWCWFSTSNGMHTNQQKAHMFNSLKLAEDKRDQYQWQVSTNPAYYTAVKIVQFECIEEEMV